MSPDAMTFLEKYDPEYGSFHLLAGGGKNILSRTRTEAWSGAIFRMQPAKQYRICWLGPILMAHSKQPSVRSLYRPWKNRVCTNYFAGLQKVHSNLSMQPTGQKRPAAD